MMRRHWHRVGYDYDLEGRALMTSVVTIGALPGAQADFADRFGSDWSQRVRHVLDHLDIPGVIDVEFNEGAVGAYGWVETSRHGRTYLGFAQGSAPLGGRATVNLAIADQFGVDPLRVMLHEVLHLLQPRLVPNSGHVDDHRSVMYAMGVPVVLYAAYGIDPENSYKLSELDRGTYEGFWRSFTPFVLPSFVQSGEREFMVGVRTASIGVGEATGVVAYDGGRVLVSIPRLGSNASWSQRVVIPSCVRGVVEFSVVGVNSASGSWPRRVIALGTGGGVERPRVDLGVVASAQVRPNEIVTIPIRVHVRAGRLSGATLTVTSPSGVVRVRVPDLLSGQQWEYRLVVRSPERSWQVSASLDGGDVRESAHVLVQAVSASGQVPSSRRPWTHRHANLFATLRGLPLWRGQPAYLVAEEVHRQLGT